MRGKFRTMIGAGALCLAALAAPRFAEAQKSADGEWEAMIPEEKIGLKPRHMILMKTGKILLLDSQNQDPNNPDPDIVVLDPSQVDAEGHPIRIVPIRAHWQPRQYFCSGHAAIDSSEGLILFAGGSGPGEEGHPFAHTFDPEKIDAGTNPWTTMDDMPAPGGERWYPSLSTLGTGKILVTAGRDKYVPPCDEDCDPPAYEDTPLLFDPSVPPGQGQWSYLGVPDPPNYKYPKPSAKVVHWYPFMFQIPDGKVFMGGGSNFLDSPAEIHRDTYKLDVMLKHWLPAVARAAEKGHSAVMYRPDKVMKGCGADPTLIEIIDLATGVAPAWTAADSMNIERHHGHLMPLVDGRVLAIGGHDAASGKGPEWYDPDESTPQWDLLAPVVGVPGQVRRNAHSTTVLLPDGRVIIAGGDYPVGENTVYLKTAQIFRPPYLFTDGPPEQFIDDPGVNARPVITSAPDEINYATAFTVNTTDAGLISKVSLVRLGAETHMFDQNTRYVPLEFTPSAIPEEITVAAPTQANLAPPGWYMMFILKPSGRPGIEYPSIAKMVRLTSS